MRSITNANLTVCMLLPALAGLMMLVDPQSSTAQEKRPGEQVTCTGPILQGGIFPYVQVYDVAGGYVCLAERIDREHNSLFWNRCFGFFKGTRPQCRITGTVQDKQYTVSSHNIVYRLADVKSVADVEGLHPWYRVGDRISCSGPVVKRTQTNDNTVRVEAYDIGGGYKCWIEPQILDPLAPFAGQCQLQDYFSADGWKHAGGRCRIDGIVTKTYDDDPNSYEVRIEGVYAMPE